MAEQNHTPKWMKLILILAGLYNIAWGILSIISPDYYFDFAGMQRINYPEIWQCLAMVVGVYGIAYFISAFDPYVHWPVILAGLVGKILGPIGFVFAFITGRFTLKAGIINLTNDLIWWIPFGIILINAYRYHHSHSK